jgi:sugar (pentulose or hexulose) kinase
VESNPQTWCDAADQVIQTCLEKNGNIATNCSSLAVSAQQQGGVTLDRGPQHLGSIGTAKIATDRLTLSLGASGVVYAFSGTQAIDSKGEISAFCDSADHWLALACTMNVANAVDGTRDLFGWELHAGEETSGARGRDQTASRSALFFPKRLPICG